MKRLLISATAAAATAVLGGGLLVASAGGAHAATPPPWEPDSSSVGGLAFYDASGHAITTGDISAPIAAYVEGTSTVRSGDSVATLYGYLPVSGQVPGQWSGEQLTGSTSYPNAAAPGGLGSSQHPVVTGSSSDETVADLIADYPNNDNTSDGYANVYQIRLLTSKPQETVSPQYDSADIQVSGSTWSVLYTAGPKTATTTKLSVSKTTVVYGKSVKLTATVAPGAGGKVQFRDGSKLLKSVAVSGGTAELTAKLAGGTHHLTARFVPSSLSFEPSTSTSHTVKVKAHRTAVKLKASPKKVRAGKAVKLVAKERPAVPGKVTFFDGKKKLGKPVAVKAGKAKLTKKLTKGTHHLKARFSPKHKANDKPSLSKAVKVRVKG